MSKLADLLRKRMRMLKEDALAVSKVVEEAFRGESELDDDTLNPQLRQVFYDLQDEKILNVRRQEYEKDGRRLRGYFWSVEEQDLEKGPWMRKEAGDPYSDLYDGLRDHAWQRKPPM